MSWWQHLFPKYGNWGGPGWSGGRYSDAPLCYSTLDREARDSMDECFKRHDQRYQVALLLYEYGQVGRSGFLEAVQVADEALIRELRELPRDPRQWPTPPKTPWWARAYRAGAVLGFWLKTRVQRIFPAVTVLK